MEKRQLYKIASGLSILTIISCLLEAAFSLYFGYADQTLTLFGFGIDSLIETVSAIGIAHMITRIQDNNNVVRDDFEKFALKITGVSFYALSLGLAFSAIAVAVTNHKPESTVPGLIISLLSILIMLALMVAKLRVGRQLNSRPIIADGNCTKVCIYMSVTLLIASLIYQITNIGYVDALGSVVIAYFSYREGLECLEKGKKS
ncbi:MAG: cation transporter [Bacteroidota bacterium]